MMGLNSQFYLFEGLGINSHIFIFNDEVDCSAKATTDRVSQSIPLMRSVLVQLGVYATRDFLGKTRGAESVGQPDHPKIVYNRIQYMLDRLRKCVVAFGLYRQISWGSKPETTESLRSQIHSRQNGFQINWIVLVAKSVVPQKM
jgi:hypothetical protein